MTQKVVYLAKNEELLSKARKLLDEPMPDNWEDRNAYYLQLWEVHGKILDNRIRELREIAEVKEKSGTLLLVKEGSIIANPETEDVIMRLFEREMEIIKAR